MNRGGVSDQEMDHAIDTIADCLSSVFVTAGALPLIRAPRGNAAERVAERVDKRLRDFNTNASRSASYDGMPQFVVQRPLLLILDRNLDLATPLHHTWTYQALVHDLLVRPIILTYLYSDFVFSPKIVSLI